MTRGSKRWLTFGLMLAILIAIPASAATIKDTFDKTWTVAPGGKLQISNENGSIDVSSWDRDEVRVRAEIKLKAGSRDAAERAMERFRIETEQVGQTITVSSRKPRGNDGFFAWLAGQQLDVDVHYEISVPRSFDVDVSTVNGSIEASRLAGALEFDSVNGRITIREARGTVSAETVNGSIDVELVEAAGERMSFETTNGRITLGLPASINADLDVATTNGKIATDIPLTTDKFSRSRVRGTLNGGGAPIRIRTVNGSVQIHPVS